MNKILDTYSGPEQIRNMTIEELNEMSVEIRNFLIENISRTGGHLAPNLGVVELTIALHNVFDFKKDKIVFDVGHQSYVHKILTGRMKDFKSLRQYKGLSGFPKTKESLYDHFNTGHASTSISAAVGMARARDLKKEDHNVIAFIGDGALTGGMTYEAINDIGFSNTKMIIVLNDNEMSISKNVGSLSLLLSHLRSTQSYRNIKDSFHKSMEKIPLGGPVSKTVSKVRDTVKSMVIDGMLFENMGLKYFGPVDGHNIKEVSKILEVAKKVEGPSIVHVITQKGRGYNYAVEKPDKFHGIAPFDLENGEVLSKSIMNYSQAFGDALCTLAKEDSDVVAITAAMRDGTGLKQFSNLYPERFFDVGIAEEHAVTLSAGMAISGIKPYVAIYSTFLQRALDQIIHDVALQNLPVKFCIDRAGIVGDDGETHQGIFDISYLSLIPEMTILAPKCTGELLPMLRWMNEYNGPSAIRYPRGGDDFDCIFTPLKTFEKGKWEYIYQGKNTLVIAVGKMVTHAFKAIRLADRVGEVGLISTTFIKPIDTKLLFEIKDDYKRVITIEDNVISGGLGQTVEKFLYDNGFKGEVITLGYDDKFIEQGSVSLLYDENNLSHLKLKLLLEAENEAWSISCKKWCYFR